jgi:hypothetical protein
MRRSIALAFMTCTLAAGIVFGACGGTQPPVNDPTSGAPSDSAPALPEPAGSGAAVDMAPPPEAATAKPPSEAEAGPPLVLNVTGPSPAPAKGEIKLTVEIVANIKISGPVTLAIKLPAGATLKSGAASETLQVDQAGTMKREYVVRTKAALASPIVVTADNAAPSGASGFHAERQYPAAGATDTAVPTAKPPAPRPPSKPPAKSH